MTCRRDHHTHDLEAVVRDALTEFFADAAARGRADDGIYGRREASLSALADLVRLAADAERCQLRLERQIAYHKHWRERAISAEQALGLYGNAALEAAE